MSTNSQYEDIEIYKGKKASDLFKEIVENSQHTKSQIQILISDLRQLVKDPNSALSIVPLIRDYVEIGIKNDDELVKLAGIVQRIITRNQNTFESESGYTLTEQERKELMEEIETVTETQKQVEQKKKSLKLNIDEV